MRVARDFHLLEGELLIAHQSSDIGGDTYRRAIERGAKCEVNLVGQWRRGQRDTEWSHGHGRNSLLNKLRGANIYRALRCEIRQIKLAIVADWRNIKTLQRN